jgi:hypothetical protein
VLRWDVLLIPSPAPVGSRCGLAAADRSSSARWRPAGRGRPSVSWSACREERQVDRVMNVVHAIRGTFGQARSDRSDDDEAVLVSEIRIQEDRGGHATAGGLLAVGV